MFIRNMISIGIVVHAYVGIVSKVLSIGRLGIMVFLKPDSWGSVIVRMIPEIPHAVP